MRRRRTLSHPQKQVNLFAEEPLGRIRELAAYLRADLHYSITVLRCQTLTLSECERHLNELNALRLDGIRARQHTLFPDE